jgi:hypothetical protein
MVRSSNVPSTDGGSDEQLPRLMGAINLPIRQEAQKRRVRVKTGCLTCRRRKKKCDEVKPACSGCHRNKLSCEWPISTHSPDRRNAEVQSADEPEPFAAYGRRSGEGRIQERPQQFFPFILLDPISWKGGASSLTKESSLFLRHYASETGDVLAVQRLHKNPFLTHILPLASSDDLLMHSVLAIGGIHLAARLPSSVEVGRSALTHYVAMVEGVRTEMSQLKNDEHTSIVRLLLILIMLCHYQVGYHLSERPSTS